jgi:hypothetical protein
MTVPGYSSARTAPPEVMTAVIVRCGVEKRRRENLKTADISVFLVLDGSEATGAWESE